MDETYNKIDKIFDKQNGNDQKDVKYTCAIYEKLHFKDKIEPTYLVTIIGASIYKGHAQYIVSLVSTCYDAYSKLYQIDNEKERSFFIICTPDSKVEPSILQAYYNDGNALFTANEKVFNDALNLFNELKQKEDQNDI